VIVHLVLFRPKADLSPADRRSLADALAAAIREIPSIRRARVGTRVMHGRPYELLMHTHYSHAAILEFDDVDGLQAYLRHPAHDALAAQFFAAFDEGLFYDFTLGEDVEALLEG